MSRHILARRPLGAYVNADTTAPFGGRNPLNDLLIDSMDSTPASSAAIAPESGGQLVIVERLPLHLYPPMEWENLDKCNYVAVPAIGASANIIDYTVPQGRNGIVNRIGCNFVGGGWVEGSGDVIWQILVDGTPPPGASDYNQILASLGSPANPVQIAGFRIFENQHLTVAISNVAVVVAGQLAGARLLGYLYPRDLEDANTWL